MAGHPCRPARPALATPNPPSRRGALMLPALPAQSRACAHVRGVSGRDRAARQGRYDLGGSLGRIIPGRGFLAVSRRVRLSYNRLGHIPPRCRSRDLAPLAPAGGAFLCWRTPGKGRPPRERTAPACDPPGSGAIGPGGGWARVAYHQPRKNTRTASETATSKTSATTAFKTSGAPIPSATAAQCKRPAAIAADPMRVIKDSRLPVYPWRSGGRRVKKHLRQSLALRDCLH
jgi:hypothetical protein